MYQITNKNDFTKEALDNDLKILKARRTFLDREIKESEDIIKIKDKKII